jgi:hypothetical protein
MDPFYAQLMTTFGPPALVLVIGIQLLIRLFGWVVAKATKRPAPVPGVPDSPLIAPSPTPTLLALARAWAKAHGHPIPATLLEISGEVLSAIRADLDRVHTPTPAPPKN